jgi:hypothetical protein
MTRKTYRRKCSKKSRHTIKGRYTRKSRKYTRKGGNGDDKTNCCMCEKEIKISESLIPRVCLQKYGSRAHRICKNCWFDGPDAFANEHRKHDCPGCEKGLPITRVPEKPKITEVIDLTDE